MTLEPVQYVLAALSGGMVAFSLGLVGGGGSILAVPLMIYLVGVTNPHVAIGTSALSVAASAATALVSHARAGNVKWRCALMFAASGVVGAFGGSTLGKAIDGQKMLALFAIVMVIVGAMMLRGRGDVGNPGAACNRQNAPKVLGFGLGSGAFSGFFGIGGGFLIVPGLMLATGMPIAYAIGTSLVAVAVFGATTASNYALSGLVDWRIAGLFVAGGVVGGIAGTFTGKKLGSAKGTLSMIFAIFVILIGIYVTWKGLAPLLSA